MIKLKELSIRNFMSFGNNTTVVNLDDELHTIIRGVNKDSQDPEQGRNGVGKTTMFHALCYVLFGETFVNIRAADYVNLTNKKGMEVSLKIGIGSDEFHITRARKPEKKEILLNGQPWSTATAKGFDEAIENLVGMDLLGFTTAFCLSTKTTHFLHMKPAGQRDFMERLLKLDLLSTRAKALKENHKELKADIRIAESEQATHLREQSQLQDDIHSVDLDSKAWNLRHEETIAGLKGDIKTYSSVDLDQKREAIKAHDAQVAGYREVKIAHDQLCNKADNARVNFHAQKQNCENIRNSIRDKEDEESFAVELLHDWAEQREQKFSHLIQQKQELNRYDIKGMREKVELQVQREDAVKASRVALEEVQGRIRVFYESISDFDRQVETTTAEKDHYTKTIPSLSQDLNRVLEQIDHLEGGTCPFCSQQFYSEEKVAELHTEANKIQDSINGTQDAISRCNRRLKELEEQMNATADKAEPLINEEAELLEEISDLESHFIDRGELQAKLTRIGTQLEQIDSDLKSWDENAVNPYKAQAEMLEGQVKNLNLDLSEALDKEKVAKDELDTLVDKAQQMLASIGNEPVFTGMDMEEILRIEAKRESLAKAVENKESEQNPHTARLEELKSRVAEFDDSKLKAMVEEEEHYTILVKLLTDNKSYVRKAVLDQYVPFLNAKINEYLEELDAQQRILINADMSIDVEYLGETISAGNLSTGEQLRAQLAIALAVGDLYEANGISFNALFIDELFDAGSDPLFMQRAFKLIRQKYTGSFLISHKEELLTRVDSVMNVVKEHGFSTVETE